MAEAGGDSVCSLCEMASWLLQENDFWEILLSPSTACTCCSDASLLLKLGSCFESN